MKRKIYADILPTRVITHEKALINLITGKRNQIKYYKICI